MSTHFHTHLQDLFAGFGTVELRRLFGSQGLYLDGVIIGVLADEVLYLKTDAATRARFETAGGVPFAFRSSKAGARDGWLTTSYWSLPGEAMESAQAMRPWAELARQAALRKRATPRPRKTRKGKPG